MIAMWCSVKGGLFVSDMVMNEIGIIDYLKSRWTSWGFLYQVAGNLNTFKPWKQPCGLLISYPKRKRKPCSIFPIVRNLEIDDMSGLVWGSILRIS